ncbi:hypothetical protein HMI54_009608 [Coelomomyces lativittatus]|nr:hypothetical protein HMI54_009608 [Coelomomyces lativittatus]
MLNADIATLKANIFAIEKEIKLSFSNRREKAHESIKFHYQDLPSETALKLSNSASFASKSLSGQVNLKSLHGYEELLHRAKISLKQHQEMKGASSKSREIGTQSQLKAMEEKIQLTRQQYYQKSAMAEAGPKYTHHFLTLNGIVLHIEIIKSNKILVLTSKGFLELWMCSNGRQWTMTSCQLLSPRLPKLTCVKVMAPTPLEQHHLATNRVQYLKHHASSSANSFTEKNNLASKERQVDINSTDESLKQFTSETYYFGGSSTSSNVLKEAKSTHLYYVNLINWLSNPREVKTYLLGCINGEVYTYDIGVNENQQVYVKFLHKVQASVTPIKFITYFAPGHRVVLHSHQQDQNGQLTQGLSIFSIPRLDLIQHLPFDKLFSTIPEEVSQSEKETDLWLIPLSSLVADNIRMRLYIGLGCYLFEFMYRDLPLTNESTYTITKTNVAIEESSLEISETSNEDLQNTTEPSFLIELSNSLSLSFRARNLNNSLSNSLPQDTYLQFNMPEPILNEKTDV